MTRHFLSFFCFTLLTTLSLFSCKWFGRSEKPVSINGEQDASDMMEIPPLPSGGAYAAEWKAIDSLEQEGLLRSALEKTEALHKRAADDKNGAQIVKCLLFRGKYTTLLEEDGLAVAMLMMETETEKLQQPEKSVMQSLLGEMYPKYHANKRWEISQRTPLSGDEGGDILTWSGARIARQASDLYAASVEQAELLRTVPVSRFSDVLYPGENDSIAGQPLRSSLYDLLAHRAIEYYSNDLNFLNEPVYEFILDQDFSFAPHGEFQDKVFDSRDGYSGKWRAIRLFQELLKSYNTDNQGDQTIRRARLYDADLARLQFVYANSVLDNKTDLYRKALENLEQESRDNPVNPEIVCELARLIVEIPDNKADNAKLAVGKLEDAVRRFPATLGAKRCESLLAEIRKPQLSLSVESVSLPGRHILASVGYSNLGKVFVKVVQGNNNDNKEDNWGNQEGIKSLKSVSQLIWTLSDPADYQPHRTEISVDPLQPGRYWLLVSDNPGFDEKKGVFAYAEFSVSNIAATTLRAENKSRLVLCDRTTGAPLPDVKVDFFYTDYRGNERKLVPAGSSVSDKNGIAEPVKSGNRDFLSARASLGQDSLWIGGAYDHENRGKWRPYPTVHFFTDRVIYRPGQTVYFKGIVFQNDEQNKPEILPNKSVTVTFFDVNDTKKGELKLKSNAFGTFNGAFTAPTGGLTGTMRIEATEGAGGSQNIKVEEYKRPRFEVKFNPVKGSFRLNDAIAVTGEARNYAGNAVDGAQVRYRVVREARFPYFYGWYRSYMPSSPSREIVSGTTTTDVNGSFTVKFDAVPDQAVARKEQPVFTYTVYADITDITGETRSQETAVSAAYQSMQVNWQLPQEVSVKDLAKSGIATTNMAGEPVPTEGKITFQKLVEPKRFFLERYWEKPDLPVLAKPDFESKFPDLAWGDEDNPQKWGREDFTRTVNFNTAEQKSVDLNEGKTGPGWYIFKLATVDSYGEKMEIERIVRVFDDKSTFYTPGARMEKESSEPGEKAVMILGGKPANLHFFVASGKNPVVQWIKTTGKETVSFPVTEADRGGLSLAGFCVRNNRYYILNQYVSVPWSNKDLQIRYETFRDKLAPGEKETWKIHISGPQKEKVAAEMVATLYDASLDQFIQHEWHRLPYPQNGMYLRAENQIGFGLTNGYVLSEVSTPGAPGRSYPSMNWFDFPFWNPGVMAAMGAGMPKAAFRNNRMEYAMAEMSDDGVADLSISYDTVINNDKTADESKPANFPATMRRNLDETVFFFPGLHTDSSGNVILKFTMNEALTRWKLLTYAHTKDLKQAISEKEVVTQKELMIIANPPRFLREGDEIEFSAKVSNLSTETLTGTATLNLLDAATLQPVEQAFGLARNNRVARFSVLPGQSGAVSWRIQVPEKYNGAVTWQIYADARSFRDGEESTIPVVSNRMLVTETLPMALRGNQTKRFSFDNLKNNTGGSLTTQKYTLEFTSNPVWYAVQSLPYLMEYPYECSEQIFSRYYANSLASTVVEKMPNIRNVYERWKGTDAMKSNLSKNQELKYALLEETPWVLEAQSEEQQKQNIALLFDLNHMADERARALRTLAERQASDGGWSWFPGGESSWYVTQYITTGLLRLQKLGVAETESAQLLEEMTDKALGFCDAKLRAQYNELERLAEEGKIKMDDDHLDGMAIQYLYMRSFTTAPDRPSVEAAYYLSQAQKYWLGKGLYQEGMISLALHRWAFGASEVAPKIVNSLRERATVKEELGMYWPVDWGYYWYQLPVETQALMVEVFGEVGNDRKAVDELRIWLLKNKQTNRWESTKATSEAVYALLMFGDNWLNNTRPVQVTMGSKPLVVDEYEAGTGYFKKSWTGEEVKNEWADITVANPNSNIVWGAAYWQYFEDLDKIKDFKKTPLTIVKQLFLEENTPAGPVLKPVAEGQQLHRGDRLKVRIELRADRAMEFVHLKDMRAAGFEPVNVLSGYRFGGGLGYYESTRDLATNFFIDYLPRGTFVFEYPLVVSLRGSMSNGITTAQCMYAPEFSSHSKGTRVSVE